MHTLIDKYKFCCYDILQDLVRFLQRWTSTLSQNDEEDILLKWGRDVFEVIHDFSFLEHPWPLEMKLLPFSKLILGPLHLKILQPY